MVYLLYSSSVQGERNSIHKHLVFCLFVAEVLFLAGVERTDDKVTARFHSSCVVSNNTPQPLYNTIIGVQSINHVS